MMSETRRHGLRVVGTRPIRPDGVEKVTGRANFGADRAFPGMLWGKIKTSPHAHARIIKIDAEKALALPVSGRWRQRPTFRKSLRRRPLSAKAR
jgi:xanthine dehydrogenase molybdopterin-binding subunit B